jgi:predicted lipoprotein with Yx(FWY)xxD motif
MMATERRRGRSLTASVAVAALLLGCSAEDTGPAAADPSPEAVGAIVRTGEGGSELGTFLVDGDGRSLYLFTSDSPGVSSCTGECLAAWPPLLTEGEPVAEGDAQQALLGTFTREDGTVQVSYAGWPLYRYAADAAAGDVNGQGLGDVWFVVGRDGTLVRAPGTEVRDDVYGGAPESRSGY